LTLLAARHDDVDASAALALLSAQAVRERANEMLELGLANALPNFSIDLDRLPPAANFIANVIRDNYPGLNVPPHARWRHFVFAGRDLWREIARRSTWPDAAARARAEFDLAIVSVLLDAGAGAEWRFNDPPTGLTVARSEGLALASLRMFEAGLFSSDPRDPLRADASRLAALTMHDLAHGFQVNARNPIVGLDGRTALLARLGRTLLAQPDVFARCDGARPGGLFDHFAARLGPSVSVPAALAELLIKLAPIWPPRLSLAGVPLGDTWKHNAIRRTDATDTLVPLHKLSQWLMYSLIEPMIDAGIAARDLDGLTGLAEYRNGGLFIDTGVLATRDPALPDQALAVDCEAVVEWRALTVALLDRIAPLVREELGVTREALPLASILEGGTWAAGRRIARQKRADGGPPLKIISDGSVF
jgi:hypothetical protein